jgi:uncharacterized membrane protein YhaH (DUF805 family)
MYTNDPFPTSSNTVEALGAALNFSHDDLQDNQAGLLSAGQRQRLRETFRRDMMLIGGGLLLIILITARRSGWTSDITAWDDGALVSGVLVFILLVVFAVAMVIAVRRHHKDTRSGRVAQASGPIRLSTQKSWNTRSDTVYTVFLVHVADLTFKVPHRAHTLLQGGATHTIFYLPHSKKVMSIM